MKTINFSFTSMKLKFLAFAIIIIFFQSCTQVQEPRKVVYFQIDKENNIFIRCEGLKSVKLIFDWLAYDSISVKDSTVIKLKKYINDGHRTEAAYRYAVNGKLQLKVSAFSLGEKICDTLLNLSIPEINPNLTSKTIKLIKGGLCPFITNVPSPNNINYIRGWLYDNNYRLDSIKLAKMSYALYHFSMPEKLIYKLNKTYKVPVYKSYPQDIISVESNMKADKYFLISASNTDELQYAIREIVKNNTPSNINKTGKTISGHYIKYSNDIISTIFLVGINDDWSDDVLPIGLFAIDNNGPSIYARNSNYRDRIRSGFNYGYSVGTGYSSDNNICHFQYNMGKYGYSINDKFESDIYSTVSIVKGYFEGDDYYGYDIPFSISLYGDVKYITIDNHKFTTSQIEKKSDVRIHFRKLHVGENKIRITAADKFGNISSSTLSLSVVYSRNYNSNNNDYDDLESRLDDIESRLDDLDD